MEIGKETCSIIRAWLKRYIAWTFTKFKSQFRPWTYLTSLKNYAKNTRTKII